METQRIKWDKSMAVRCLARVRDTSSDLKGNTSQYTGKISDNQVKPCCNDEEFSINIAKGEWDDFQRSISTVYRKRHK